MKNNQLIFYYRSQDEVKVEVFYLGETFWLAQKAMAVLVGVAIPAISKHLKNIFETGELKEKVVNSILEHTTQLFENHFPHVRQMIDTRKRTIKEYLQVGK